VILANRFDAASSPKVLTSIGPFQQNTGVATAETPSSESGTITRLGLFAISSILSVVPRIASAQPPSIAVDGSLAPARPLGVGPQYTIDANLGKQVGSNLFHSFSRFGLGMSESATFTSVGSSGPISNVIGRVTGGTPSWIDGKVSIDQTMSNIAGANLYLINPSGIAFGSHASVSIAGSFHASSADYIRMSDGKRFQATNPGDSTLSCAPPAAFGFLNATPGAIAVNGTTLGVSSRQTLGLIGGQVSINDGQLSAPAGTIRVTSVAGPGEVPVAKGKGIKPTVAGYGSVKVTNNSSLNVDNGGSAFIRAGRLAMSGSSQVDGDNSGPGSGGRLVLHADSNITLSENASVHANVFGSGKGGAIFVKSGSLSISSAEIGSTTMMGRGRGGDIVVNVARALSIDGGTIQTQSRAQSTGNPGNITIHAGSAYLTNGAEISSITFGPANPGSVFVNAGNLDLQNSSNIQSSTTGSGTAGDVTVNAVNASISNVSEIHAGTKGAGNAGSVYVSISGNLSIVGPAGSATTSNSDIIDITGIGTVANPESTGGNAGSVTVKAGSLSIAGFLGEISSSTLSSGAAGKVSVDVAGPLSIAGSGGSFPTGIVAAAFQGGTGNAGDVAVRAGSLSIINGGEISATTAGSGAGGSVIVDAPQITVTSGSQISSTTAGTGKGGSVAVGMTTPGVLMLDGMGTQIAASTTGAQSGAGVGGMVMVKASSLAVQNGAQIASTTAGSGIGGSVSVMTSGALVLDGMGVGGTRIAASAEQGSLGAAGDVTVGAGNLTVQGGAQIASSTAGPGKGGNVNVMVANGVALSGAGPAEASGITTSAELGSSGDAGQVVLKAGGAVALSGGAEVASSTAGAGKGGSVSVMTPGALVLDGMGVGGTRIAASAEQGSLGAAGDVTVGAGNLTVQGGAQIASSTAGPGKGGVVQITDQGQLSLSGAGGITASSMGAGDAGSVIVDAPQITVTSGSQIASTTAGTGMGGSVNVMTPGALVLDGQGNASTGIAASATGAQSRAGGAVMVQANTLTIEGGAQIASTTAGPGQGGDVDVVVAGDITLPGPGPQITAQSTGSGDAGKITVSAVRLLMSDRGRISTEAQTANGGNITLSVSDFLYLTNSQITASVNRETGNGGNVTIDPQFVILNHSKITAQAAEGQGGNININAGLYIASTDSTVSATSQFGISGTVVISGPRVDVNGALVVLSTELRSAAEVLRHSCAAQAAQLQSTLVQGGRGGTPQDPDATLPALYIAGRDVSPNPQRLAHPSEGGSVVQTMARLTMHCGADDRHRQPGD
jgi:filamentous hemagglutinin family protein